MSESESGDLVKAKRQVTDSAKLDIIATSQAEENERHRLGVSRSFVCTCVTLRPVNKVTYALHVADTLTGMPSEVC
jgi:hypothetical protein